MSDKHQSKDLMEKLARVDNRLEEMCNLLTYQGPQPREALAGSPPAAHRAVYEDPRGYSLDDDEIEEASWLQTYEQNPLASRTAITASEAESIIQKVEKINREAEVLEKVERLERQNRKITILGSMFMTFTLLALAAFAALMVKGNLWNPSAILQAFQQGESPALASQKATAKEEEPQTAQPAAKVPDPQPAKTAAAASDPQPAQAQEVPQVRYVGSVTSNKYHHPNCKWAAQIKPEKLVTFSSVTEARKRGYIPCPSCGPPSRDP